MGMSRGHARCPEITRIPCDLNNCLVTGAGEEMAGQSLYQQLFINWCNAPAKFIPGYLDASQRIAAFSSFKLAHCKIKHPDLIVHKYGMMLWINSVLPLYYCCIVLWSVFPVSSDIYAFSICQVMGFLGPNNILCLHRGPFWANCYLDHSWHYLDSQSMKIKHI